MNIIMLNGLSLFLLFMWTSAETGSGIEYAGGVHLYDNVSRVDIISRKRACKNLGGKCIRKNQECPPCWPLATKPGRPFCNKRRHCCYRPDESDLGSGRKTCYQLDNSGEKCIAYQNKPAACDYYGKHAGDKGDKTCYVDVDGMIKPSLCGQHVQDCTLGKKKCVKAYGIDAKCGKWDKTNYQWCHTSTACPEAWYYCNGGCPNWRFKKNHICDNCDKNKALQMSQGRNYEDRNIVFANNDGNPIIYSQLSDRLNYCFIKNPVMTWKCDNNGKWWSCNDAECCIGRSDIGDGHYVNSKCVKLPANAVDCKGVKLDWGNEVKPQ